MHLVETSVGPSPVGRDRTRAACSVVYADGARERYWFDVPAGVADFLSRDGDPWLVLLFPIALDRNEDISSELSIDAQLAANLQRINRIWRLWYPKLASASIEAPRRASGPETRRSDRDVCAFFSGGVDSSFTVLREAEEPEHTRDDIRDLIFVWGFNLPFDKMEEFERLSGRVELMARALDKHLVPVATNIREHQPVYQRGWGPLGHGAAMASIAHLLSPRYRRAVIASSNDFLSLGPWGSHPLVDPLWSSGDLTITQDGAQFTRMEKIERVAEHPELLRHLHVCWQERSADNCSRCEKCLRTMTALVLLGKADQSPCFDWSQFRLDRVADIELVDQSDIGYYRELEQAAAERGREDIRTAVQPILQESRGTSYLAGAARAFAPLPRLKAASRRLVPRRRRVEPTV